MCLNCDCLIERRALLLESVLCVEYMKRVIEAKSFGRKLSINYDDFTEK